MGIRKYVFAVPLFVGAGLLVFSWASPGPEVRQGQQSAGELNVPVVGHNSFSFPFATLSQAERTRFAIGNSFFKRNWVQSPASTTGRDGLGPHFIARSCGACHAFDGRGRPPEMTEDGHHDQPVDLLIRVSVEDDHGARPHPVYGDQISNAAVPGVQPEAKVVIRTTSVQGQYPDGTTYTLNKPTYTLDQLSGGPLGEHARLSPRVAPQLIGVGLLEAIKESDILENVRIQAEEGLVSGRVNRVADPFYSEKQIGRFGWKANVASLAGQTALAFRGDIGITSSSVPSESCTEAQRDCLDAPRGGQPGEPEITDRVFNEVVFYQSVLAPPARRHWNDPEVVRGEGLFHQAQCASCHRPSYVTGKAPFPELSSRTSDGVRIWPYTDLLLHDMGPGLADNRQDELANGQEWKTPPLWGIGLIADVNGHNRLLHDGRARGVEEAILWHAGEAKASRDTFKAMKKSDREALIKFVESL
ncbi:MAG: di-heme oxidoredictase family protein [Limnobacter sp.]|nr:di-heme oxidoredictase family protein [Limnobacter sp.]